MEAADMQLGAGLLRSFEDEATICRENFIVGKRVPNFSRAFK